MINEENINNVPMSEEEMRADIENDFTDLEVKNNELEDVKSTNSEEVKSGKMKALKELYAMLQDMGVNLGDIDSIGKFMAKIEAQDPDLLILIENAISGLDPEGQQGQQVIPGSEGAPMPPMPGGMPQMTEGLMPPTQGATHTMPDGTVMQGATHEEESAPGGLMDKFSGLQNQVMRR